MLIKLATILCLSLGWEWGSQFKEGSKQWWPWWILKHILAVMFTNKWLFTKYLFNHTLCICMYTTCMQMPLQATRGSCISGTGVTGGIWAAWWECSESKVSLLQEQQLLLSTDPQTKAEMILTWGTRSLLDVECLRLQTEDGKGYLQRSMCKRRALCHTSVVWGHFQTASMENNARENKTVSWTRPRSTAR